jgi:predicted Rossmann fold flavoprotein
MNTKKNHVIVIGGGASGMMAAISARRQGAEVTLLERNPRIGKKLLATGNGRCNFANINTSSTYFHGSNPRFATMVLAKFTIQETIAFFEQLGIAHKVEELGKIFPMSDQASSVLDVLMYELNRMGVTTICDAYVKKLLPKPGKFKLECANGSRFEADKVIIAAGGRAMPASGSDGNGFTLAQHLGHTLIDIFPALVQLKLEGPYFKQINGVKFVGTAEILHNQQSLAKDRGDILFTNYGISGPPILQISRKAGELLHDNKAVELKITILDTIAKEALNKLITARFASESQKTVEFSLVGLINKRLIPVILKEAGIKEPKGLAANLSSSEHEKIMTILTDWRFKVTGTNSWPNAQVTAGGIATNEINHSTMESKIINGLFFAGEIIDIDGQCGGFNLQWAWSSGFIAGQHAAR